MTDQEILKEVNDYIDSICSDKNISREKYIKKYANKQIRESEANIKKLDPYLIGSEISLSIITLLLGIITIYNYIKAKKKQVLIEIHDSTLSFYIILLIIMCILIMCRINLETNISSYKNNTEDAVIENIYNEMRIENYFKRR